MPSPVRFTCDALLPQAPDEVAAGILEPENWSRFRGWGPVPGIRRATFTHRTEAVVGTVIECVNTDGSTHVEEIEEWDPPRRLVLRLRGFSRPLSFIAREFVETWEFSPGRPTPVSRRFELWPRSVLMRPVLWVLSLLLRRAIRAQLDQLAEQDAA